MRQRDCGLSQRLDFAHVIKNINKQTVFLFSFSLSLESRSKKRRGEEEEKEKTTVAVFVDEKEE